MPIREIFPEAGKVPIAAVREAVGKEVLLRDLHDGYLHGDIIRICGLGEYKLKIRNSKVERRLMEHDLEYLAILE